MTGTRGPIPKRSEERRRRNKPDIEPTTPDLPEADFDPFSLPSKIARGLPVPDIDDGWDPLAKDTFEAVQHSQQAVYMEPSDWMVLKILCESLSRDLAEQVVGVTVTGEVVKDKIPLKGASLAAYLKGFAVLGMTEGDRRRISMELKPRVTDGRKAPVRDIKSARKSRVG